MKRGPGRPPGSNNKTTTEKKPQQQQPGVVGSQNPGEPPEKRSKQEAVSPLTDLVKPPPLPVQPAPAPAPAAPKVNIGRWSVQEVCDFIKKLPGCSDYVEDFYSQEIDGQALMLLQADHLMSAMSIKLGPALKICEQVTNCCSFMDPILVPVFVCSCSCP